MCKKKKWQQQQQQHQQLLYIRKALKIVHLLYLIKGQRQGIARMHANTQLQNIYGAHCTVHKRQAVSHTASQ